MSLSTSHLMLNGTEGLREGECYFAVAYCEDRSGYPVIETYVFIGKDVFDGDNGCWYFQEVEPYVLHNGKSVDKAKQRKCDLISIDEGQIAGMFDFPRLAEALALLAAEPRSSRK